jgi:hypothetical protein
MKKVYILIVICFCFISNIKANDTIPILNTVFHGVNTVLNVVNGPRVIVQETPKVINVTPPQVINPAPPVVINPPPPTVIVTSPPKVIYYKEPKVLYMDPNRPYVIYPERKHRHHKHPHKKR